MSTQLILFPQNYNGVSSNASFSATNEYVVDGINFNGVNGASGIMLNSTGAEIITTQPPNSVNTWYKSKSNASQSYPSASGGVLSLTSWASLWLEQMPFLWLQNMLPLLFGIIQSPFGF